MSDVSRRQMLTTGAVGIAGFAAAIATQSAQANTQDPPEPQTSVNPNGRFTGQVVLITGATSGIGEATARAFAAEGATVHFCGRREVLGEQVAQSIRDAGGKAIYQRADVRIEDDVKAFVNSCVEQHGRIDIAFNNAGIFMTPAEIQDIPLDNFIDILTTNTVGEFLCLKYEIPQMRRQGGGNIINMASVAGHVGFRTTAHYNASKHGVIGLTKAAAQENADHNIRINSISPLAVDTPQLRESFAFQGITYEQAVQGFVTKRIMTTHEMSEAVMFLASNQATSMTGMDLDVTGGQLAG
ncbi:SDR family oxidoreductase [Nodosilinea sp. LEGE 07298]|uniref:SDR family NAD(P)-dependent oxidoreductase n=1 Tax=Nodosilinea sp. LEGE 07298 TaxID=2777970 RepID=UPI00187F82E6|nr:SDR family NAD(P)-dependent oxidoreductase [Nodosilinea sp. LEGE 07298]MBE9108157.1 SDR family oxidoreductase [Nodosilinea sp. LEGE 07298]